MHSLEHVRLAGVYLRELLKLLVPPAVHVAQRLVVAGNSVGGGGGRGAGLVAERGVGAEQALDLGGARAQLIADGVGVLCLDLARQKLLSLREKKTLDGVKSDGRCFEDTRGMG